MLAQNRPVPARAAAAGRTWLWAVALVAAGALVWLLAAGVDAPHDPESSARLEEPAGGGSADAPGTTSPVGGSASERAAGQGAPERTAGSPAGAGRTAPGEGRIRGELQLGNVDPPETWTLELRPSLAMRGTEGGTARTLELTGDELNFELRDLPLAAYDLTATAPGFNGRTLPIVLSPQVGDIAVVLGLAPAGSLAGRVADENQRPLDDLPLILVGSPSGERRLARTDSLGGFLFEGVPDGTWALHLGAEKGGLVDPRGLSIQAPGMTLPTIEVPAMGSAVVLVRDADGTPVPGARVRGYGRPRGHIDGETDAEGRLRVHFLPPGRYTVRTAVDDLGRSVRDFEIEAPEDPPVDVALDLSP